MGFVDGFVLADGVVPGAGFAEGLGAGPARFGVGGIEGEGAVAVGDGGFVVFKLERAISSTHHPPVVLWNDCKGGSKRGIYLD